MRQLFSAQPVFEETRHPENVDDNYFTLHSQQHTQSSVQAHATFITGAGMSIRHGAWVFGVPSCLKTEYPKKRPRGPCRSPGVYPHSGSQQSGTQTPDGKSQNEPKFPGKNTGFAANEPELSLILSVFHTQNPVSSAPSIRPDDSGQQASRETQNGLISERT
jgi:hypothetical protein